MEIEEEIVMEDNMNDQNEELQDNEDDKDEIDGWGEPIEKTVKRYQSWVWEHMEKYVDNGIKKARCNFCKKGLMANSKKNGTSSLANHLKGCKKSTVKKEKDQTLLNFQAATKKDGASDILLNVEKVDNTVIRRELLRWIITNELPLSTVDKPGFKRFMSFVVPKFNIPSRRTFTRDCFSYYDEEKAKLKRELRENTSKFCFTTDTWTSVQQINYMCLTVHWIDNDWKLQKRILNFCPIDSHRGDAIGREIELCLFDWGIKDVFTITIDNASSNDGAVAHVRKKCVSWGTAVLGGKLMQNRCIAHIANLIASDGLKEVDKSVHKVRASVRYIRKSPARLKRFSECSEFLKIQSKKMLCLDVPTRWNSTYVMLDVAQRFEKAFTLYGERDCNFVSYLKKPFTDEDADLVDQVEQDYATANADLPTSTDWENVRHVASMLEVFYEFTVRVSGSLYVTSNTYLDNIVDLHTAINNCCDSLDPHLSSMGGRMRTKYHKYWGDMGKVNHIVFVATALDPRCKMVYVSHYIKKMYGRGLFEGQEMITRVNETLKLLYNEYAIKKKGVQDAAGDTDAAGSSSPSGSRRGMKRFREEVGDDMEGGSELDKYLAHERVKDTSDFDILEWWKIHSNQQMYPILASLARDILAVPVSTVASESTFSTGGRIVDCFRSSLNERTVQALVCIQDWVRPSGQKIDVEEHLEEINKVEQVDGVADGLKAWELLKGSMGVLMAFRFGLLN